MKMRLAEQVILLSLNETSGKIYPLPEQYLDYAIAGSLLMELVLKEHARLHQGLLRTLKQGPIGDPILDTVLRYLPTPGNSEPATQALAHLATRTSQWTNMLLEDLAKKGVLEQGSYRYLWFFSETTHPVTSSSKLETDVKKTLREILFQGKMPTEDETVLLGIANACNLLSHIFSPEDLRAAEPRIRKLIRFEIINHVVSNALDEFQNTVAATMASLGA